jgi:hypothetical protein
MNTAVPFDHEFREVESPLPWHIDRDDKHPGIRDAHNNPVAALISIRGEDRVMAEANAELIVRAVNAHDALLNALRLLHDNLAEYQRLNNLGGYDNHDMVAARDAIAKAEGRS